MNKYIKFSVLSIALLALTVAFQNCAGDLDDELKDKYYADGPSVKPPVDNTGNGIADDTTISGPILKGSYTITSISGVAKTNAADGDYQEQLSDGKSQRVLLDVELENPADYTHQWSLSANPLDTAQFVSDSGRVSLTALPSQVDIKVENTTMGFYYLHIFDLQNIHLGYEKFRVGYNEPFYNFNLYQSDLATLLSIAGSEISCLTMFPTIGSTSPTAMQGANLKCSVADIGKQCWAVYGNNEANSGGSVMFRCISGAKFQ